MPVYPQPPYPIPSFWSFYGHSYYQGSFGTHNPSGRSDAIIRNLFNLNPIADTKNHAALGSKLTYNGTPNAGWVRVMQNEIGNVYNPGYPYVAPDGAFFLGWGINDLGNNTNTTQNNTAYQQALRAVISRCRCAVVWDDDSAAFTYGAGFTNVGTSWETSSGNTYRTATSTTNATISWTIPADYHGEVIAFLFLSVPGVNGAQWSFGGTAGVTATVSTSNIISTAAGRCPVVYRIKTLTSANAGQTITLTVTSLDAGGSADFDGCWIESQYPPPILVGNTPRLNQTGYNAYTSTFPTMADADVVTFNTYLTSLISEFDSMVQVVDIDSALNKDVVALGTDGLHPSEYGAAKIADAFFNAYLLLRPTGVYGEAIQMNPGNQLLVPAFYPRVSGGWYYSPCFGGNTGTAYSAVAQDLFALPMLVGAQLETWSTWSVETLAGSASATIEFAIFDDRGTSGFPKYAYATPCSSPITLATGANIYTSIQSAGNGYILQPMDPGLYWVVIRIATAGTGVTFRTMKGPSPLMPMMALGGGTATYCGWKATGQASMPKSWPFPGAVQLGTPVDNVPMIGIRKY